MLSLFPMEPACDNAVIADALGAGATLSVSISGGKDSQAMLRLLSMLASTRGWTGHAEIVHADLGRAEWRQTPGHVVQCAAEAGWPLVIVQREKGDLVDRIEDRLNTVSTIDPTRVAKPFWPSPAQRYCTSDLKRGPIQKHIRTLGQTAPAHHVIRHKRTAQSIAPGRDRFRRQRVNNTSVVISAMGLRASESTSRERRPVVELDTKTCASAYVDWSKRGLSLSEILDAHRYDPQGRLVLNWLPIHDWSDAQVWEILGSSLEDLDRRRAAHRAGREAEALAGWEAHPAYVLGNERLSCSLCIVFGSRGDLLNGIRHAPALAQRYAELEEQTGYTIRPDLSIADLILEANPASCQS